MDRVECSLVCVSLCFSRHPSHIACKSCVPALVQRGVCRTSSAAPHRTAHCQYSQVRAADRPADHARPPPPARRSASRGMCRRRRARAPCRGAAVRAHCSSGLSAKSAPGLAHISAPGLAHAGFAHAGLCPQVPGRDSRVAARIRPALRSVGLALTPGCLPASQSNAKAPLVCPFGQRRC